MWGSRLCFSYGHAPSLTHITSIWIYDAILRQGSVGGFVYNFLNYGIIYCDVVLSKNLRCNGNWRNKQNVCMSDGIQNSSWSWEIWGRPLPWAPNGLEHGKVIWACFIFCGPYIGLSGSMGLFHGPLSKWSIHRVVLICGPCVCPYPKCPTSFWLIIQLD